MWRNMEIVEDLTRCLKERMLRVDEHLSIEFVLERCRHSSPNHFPDYVSLLKMVVQFASLAQLNEIVELVDQHLRDSLPLDPGCIKLLNELVNR